MIVVLCFLLLNTVHAQTDALSAMQKICTAYNSKTAISFNGSLKMYIKNSPGKIIEKMKSSYVLKGKNFSCIIGPVEMLLNKDYYVSVDKTIKLIIIGNKRDLSGTEQIPVLNTSQFKTWIAEKIIEASVTSYGGDAVLQLTDQQGITGYNLYNITYDRVTGYMKKVVLEISDRNDPAHKTVVLEINYSRPVVAIKNEERFSEKQFFSVINTKIKVTNSYRGYQLINQL